MTRENGKCPGCGIMYSTSTTTVHLPTCLVELRRRKEAVGLDDRHVLVEQTARGMASMPPRYTASPPADLMTCTLSNHWIASIEEFDTLVAALERSEHLRLEAEELARDAIARFEAQSRRIQATVVQTVVLSAV